MCQPLRRAMAASFASGFTATGNPTHSRSGRSEAESAYAIDSPRSSPSARGVLGEDEGARLARRWELLETTGEVPVFVASELSAHHLVEQRPHRLDDEVQCPCDQNGAVTERPVAPYTGDSRREGPREEQIVEQLSGVLAQQFLGRSFVTAVEAAQEVPAVAAVEREQTRGFAKDPCRHPGPIAERQMTRRQPCIRLDDVRGHERVLEIERGEMTVRRKDRTRCTLGTSFHLRTRRGRADACVLDDRREVDLVHVPFPVDHSRVEAEQLTVLRAEPVPQLEKPVHPEQGFGLGVRPVQLHVTESAFC